MNVTAFVHNFNLSAVYTLLNDDHMKNLMIILLITRNT
jgi:hypothetical protein